MKTLIGAILGVGAGIGISMLLRPKPEKKVAVYSKATTASVVEKELTNSGIPVERVELKNPDGVTLLVSDKDSARALSIVADLEKSGKLKKAEMGRVNIVSPGGRMGFSEKFVEDLHYS